MKIATLSANRVIALPFDGIFVRDLPIKAFEEMFKGAEARLEAEDHTFIEDIFQKLVCDGNGDTFEDLEGATFEQMSQIIPINLMYEIVQAIPAAITPAGADMGNSKRTGKRK